MKDPINAPDSITHTYMESDLEAVPEEKAP
jgi:hypothetical protein